MLLVVAAALAEPPVLPSAVPPFSVPPRACTLPSARVGISHMPASAVAQREADLAALEVRPPRATPLGGLLYVGVASADINAADVARYTLVALGTDGTELVRATGTQWTVPDVGPDRAWRDWFVVSVESAPTYPLTVYVVDQVDVQRCAWVVLDDGSGSISEGAPPVLPPAPPVPMSPCRWPRVDTVSSSTTIVTINGLPYTVVGRPNWEAFQRELQVCGYAEAADALYRWRLNRRWTNGLAGSVYGLAFAVVPGIAAGQRRAELEQALLAGK